MRSDTLIVLNMLFKVDVIANIIQNVDQNTNGSQCYKLIIEISRN